MCKYCNNYIGDDYELEFINHQEFDICEGVVTFDIDMYIGNPTCNAGFLKKLGHDENDPYIYVITGYSVNKAGPYGAKTNVIPIKYCPFCGLELKKARESINWETEGAAD